MKRALPLMFAVLLIALAACNTTGPVKEPLSAQSPVKNPRPVVKGVEDVDVLNTHGRIEGIERMQRFYENVQNGTASELRVVYYTIEGDPLVKDLTFDGESIAVKFDTTRDTYGSGEIIQKSCGNLIKEVNPTNISYIALDCTSGRAGMEEILYISYNMDLQDRFEFELAYGEDLENGISTLQHDNSAKWKNVKQEVCKKLVLANYLAEKKLATTCEAKDGVEYSLKVYINQAQREFRWNSCDASTGGGEFTEIAQYIIEQSDRKHNGKAEVTVQGYVLKKEGNTLLIGEDLNRFDYEWLKDEITRTDLNSFNFEFTELQGVDTEKFELGDKIQATIDGKVTGSKPGEAKVKEIVKLK